MPEGTGPRSDTSSQGSPGAIRSRSLARDLMDEVGHPGKSGRKGIHEWSDSGQGRLFEGWGRRPK